MTAVAVKPNAAADAAAIRATLAAYRRERLHIDGFRAAAVLVPLLPTPDGFDLVFTVRSAQLANHAGQIAFPGGAVEPGEDVVEAALRETWEEIGVRIDRDDVLGLLDEHPSPAGFVATPVVAVLDPAARFRAEPREVADIFSAPARELLEIAPSWEERRLEKFRRRIHYYPWRGRLIWGFTGNVLKNFLEVAMAAPERGERAAGSDGRAW